jgi:hypothetical protein
MVYKRATALLLADDRGREHPRNGPKRHPPGGVTSLYSHRTPSSTQTAPSCGHRNVVFASDLGRVRTRYRVLHIERVKRELPHGAWAGWLAEHFTGSAAHDILVGGGFVDVLLPPAAVGLVGHLVTRLDRGRDPWPGPLPARAGADLWPQLGAVGQLPNPPRDWTGDDPLAAGVLEALEANA